MEGLKKVQLGDVPKRYFLIGEMLAEHEEQELVRFLKERVNVFTWTPQEMQGSIPRSFVTT